MLFKKEGKKATAPLEDSLLVLFELIILAIAGTVLFLTVKSLVKDPMLEQRTVASDIALYLDTLYSAPGPIVGFYTRPEYDFLATVEQGDYNKVTVKGVEPDARSLGNYLFHPDAALSSAYTQIQTKALTAFVRQGRSLTGTRASSSAFNNQLGFASIPPLQEAKNIRIYADPSMVHVQQQMTVGTKVILSVFAERLEDVQKADMILILKGTSDSPATLKLFIPQNSPASRYLAYLIQQELPVYKYSSIIPISPGFLKPEDQALLLRSSIPSVLVSLSSSDLDVAVVAVALDTAIKQYLSTPTVQPSTASPNMVTQDDVQIISQSGGVQ